MIKPFLKYLLNEKRYSVHTVGSYEIDLLQFQSFLEDLDADLDQASTKMLRAWIVSLIEEGKSPRSVNRKIASLRTYYKFLLKRELIKKNPALNLKPLKTAKQLPQFVQKSEMNNLLDHSVFSDDFEGHRDRVIMELLYSTGIRRAELIGLKEEDVDLFNGTIKVLGKRNKERIIPLAKSNVALLKSYISSKNNAGFESPFMLVTNQGKQSYPMMINRIVKKYLGYISNIDKKSPHVLRHTFATHMLDNGADLNAVKDLLGHASLAATQVYTHNSLEKLKTVFDQAHPKA
ncbi:tyrosine-type recombinase/integrase [Reichenbachiella sp. ABR2-5]|uniref:Tyrosine recombinase XerC n=1 Tax=Reichenbachiella ulvae TaxID=2980104 RepID=A0ABT3D0A2_9BACT|nr:tyrosine-type recombinase/integrase [Reichenbachiella ulvae]